MMIRLRGFVQLFLICIHWQVCQCYAGGNVHRDIAGLTKKMIRISDSLHRQSSLVMGRSCDYCQRNRIFDTQLRQASIATSIDDEEGSDTRSIHIRGGSTESSSEVAQELTSESNESMEHISNESIGSSLHTSSSNNTLDSVQEVPVPLQQQQPPSTQKEISPNIEMIGNSNTLIRKKKWPCGDDLDKQLIKIALPCIANFAINPLVGAVDLFWINRMGNTLAVAGQAAANQIYTSSFWLTSFLPSVTATLVAKQYAMNSDEGVQDSVCQALVVGTFVAVFGTLFILSQPDRLLGGVLAADAPARQFARPYLFIRGFAFLPSMFSLIGFSAFRGVMDTVTPLKISLFANLMNAILDPILIFACNMGVTGAALATLAAEVTSAVMFTTLLLKRKMITPSKMLRLPVWSKLAPLLKGGAALQIRNFALNITFLAVTRVTQSIDNTGVAAAAHAMAIQTFQIGGIVLLALSTVAQTVVPNEMIERIDEKSGEKKGGIIVAKDTVSRLMRWGLILGSVLGSLQVLLIPHLQKSTPVLAVREAARVPALLASLYQVINGLVFIGEGVMVGTGSFLQLSLSTMVATIGTVLALNKFPNEFGLTGVWLSFGVFNSLRFLGVLIHQKINGPLAARNTTKLKMKET